MTAICKGEHCGAEIGYALTVPKGKLMPIDPDSAGAEDGLAIVWRQNGVTLCIILGRDAVVNPKVAAVVTRYRAHWQSCPDAREFTRKGKRAEAPA